MWNQVSQESQQTALCFHVPAFVAWPSVPSRCSWSWVCLYVKSISNKEITMNRSCWFWFQHLKNMHAMQVCFIVTLVWQYVYRWLESVLHVLARLTRRVPLVEQELLVLPQHLSSLRFLIEVCVTRSLVLYVCFVDCCLSFCIFSFGHCVVCSSSIYGFWLPFGIFKHFLRVVCWF
jgi:hypothetical protein